MPHVFVTLEDTENGVARSYSFAQATVVLGRDEAADLRIVRGYVSMMHGRIRCDRGRVFYTDLGSSNGTILERRQLRPLIEVPLSPGAKLWIGATRITIEVREQGGAVAPEPGPDPFGAMPADGVGGSSLASPTPPVATRRELGERHGLHETAATPLTAEEPAWPGDDDASQTQRDLARAASPPSGVPKPRGPDVVVPLNQAPANDLVPTQVAPPRPMARRPVRPELPPGTTLGDYRIVRLIGSGGMGQVYEARHASLGKPVALKVLLSEVAKDPVFQERFCREAMAASQLQNPHIVDVTHLGTENGVTFIVMELLRGESLATIIDRDGPISIEKAVEILLPVCWALYTSHKAGVVHRDLKPPNIFLHRAPMNVVVPKILDFGVLKLVDVGPEWSLTDEGDVIGTPEYVAPEAVLSGTVDALTDLYALGVILYECVTGLRPFVGMTAYQIMSKVTEGECKPPRAIVPAIPEAFESIILKAMHREPLLRFQSVLEFARELAPYAPESRRPFWLQVFRDTGAHPVSVRTAVQLPPRALAARAPAVPAAGSPGSDGPALVADQPVEQAAVAEEGPATKVDATPRRSIAPPWRWVVLPVVAALIASAAWFLQR